MNDHAATALDQLRLADDLTDTREQAHANALAAAHVHALLQVAYMIQTAAVVDAEILEWVPDTP